MFIRFSIANSKLTRVNLLFMTFIYTIQCHAACDNYTPATEQTVSCSGATTTNIAAIAGSSNVVVNILTGASLNIVRTPNPVAIDIENSSQINNNGSVTLTGGGGAGANRGAALLGRGNNNTILNNSAGIINTTGAYNDGMAANGSGNTLTNNGLITTAGPNAYGMSASWMQTGSGQPNNTLINNGNVTTNGSSARAVSIFGQNGVVMNTGTLLTTGNSSTTVYMQGNNASLINSGLIHSMGALSEGIFSNTVTGGFTARIENSFGGQIISDQNVAIRTLNGATTIINAGLLQGGNGTAINGGTGNVALILQTGSAIIGIANGGAGNNQVTLQGSGQITNPFSNFQTLYMQGNEWVWQGSGTFANSYIQSGSLQLQTSLTGNVAISSGASLLAGNGANPSITPYPGGPPITVTNAGLIDLSNGAGSGSNSLTIQGNYTGVNGILRLQSVLAGDNAPSDRLIISEGSASGTTGINIINLAGQGAETLQNGILVVQAINGASTDAAFTLNAPAAAGAYEYFLFKGGFTADSAENWYLRSSFSPTDPADPAQPSPLPPPTPGATPATGTGSVVPIYRVETPLYSAVQPVLRQTSIALLSTFHERRGEQSVIVPAASLSETWVRVFGQNTKHSWAGTVAPSFDGNLFGFQAGIDLLSTQSTKNHRNNAGVFLGQSRVTGAVKGFALGWNNYSVGNLAFNGTSLGAYWTYLGSTNGYLDAVLMNTWFNGNTNSSRNLSLELDNTSFLASLEGGYPFVIFPKIDLEPQAQIIWKNQSRDRRVDPFSPIVFNAENGFTGRLGLRLQSNLDTVKGLFQPYLRANVWHNFSDNDTVRFGNTRIIAQNEETALQLGGGIVHPFSQYVSAFVTADYAFNVRGEALRTWAGNGGVRVHWG